MRLINDDCLSVLIKAPSECVDLIVTDPPYKLTSRGTSGTMGGEFWKSELTKNGKVFREGFVTINDWIDECYRILKDGTHIYIMTNDKNLTEYLIAIENSKFEYVKTIIWKKPNKICGRWYMTQKETIILARKGKQRPINNPSSSDIIETPDFKKTKIKKEIDGNLKDVNIHDTEKPIELMKIFIENSSNEGEIVLDLFMGSGSTGVACKEANRKFIGIEKDLEYFNIAKNRIEKAVTK